MDDTTRFPAIPRLSATILPVRQMAVGAEQEGFHVLMIKRAHTLRVLPGFLVFPGGTMDLVDVRVGKAWARLAQQSPSAEQLKHWSFGADFEWVTESWPDDQIVHDWSTAAFSFLSTGLRELIEETGLALPEQERWSDEELAKLRDGCAQLWSAKSEGSIPRGRIRYFGRRITPAMLKHRFDTHYIVAEVDSELEHRVSSLEVEDAFWASPQAVLMMGQQALGGSSQDTEQAVERIAPPTIDALSALARYSNVDDLFLHGSMPAQVDDVQRINAHRQQLTSDSSDKKEERIP